MLAAPAPGGARGPRARRRRGPGTALVRGPAELRADATSGTCRCDDGQCQYGVRAPSQRLQRSVWAAPAFPRKAACARGAAPPGRPHRARTDAQGLRCAHQLLLGRGAWQCVAACEASRAKVCGARRREERRACALAPRAALEIERGCAPAHGCGRSLHRAYWVLRTGRKGLDERRSWRTRTRTRECVTRKLAHLDLIKGRARSASSLASCSRFDLACVGGAATTIGGRGEGAPTGGGGGTNSVACSGCSAQCARRPSVARLLGGGWRPAPSLAWAVEAAMSTVAVESVIGSSDAFRRHSPPHSFVVTRQRRALAQQALAAAESVRARWLRQTVIFRQFLVMSIRRRRRRLVVLI